jgi:hypothetical protein
LYLVYLVSYNLLLALAYGQDGACIGLGRSSPHLQAVADDMSALAAAVAADIDVLVGILKGLGGCGTYARV